MAQPCLLDLDQEQKNFFCLTILINDVGNKSLREYFKNQWPIVYQKVKGTPPPAPWTNIPNDAAEMNNIEKKLKLKPNDKAKFDTGDTEKWDFSLLSSVLLHSSLGFVNPSSPEKSALEDLKDVRNELVGHNTSSKIDDAKFKSNWTKACNALKLFGAAQADFTDVEDVLKKPSETLAPILKNIAATEEDIRDSILKFVQKIEENHKDVVEKISHNQDELKAMIKEEGQLTRSLLKERSKGQSRHVLMAEDQRELLEELLPKFQNEVIATDLLDNLPCLTEEQKDQIANHEKTSQSSKGVRTLVEKLEEHGEGFEQLVQALRKADLGHVAVILDADFEEHNKDDKNKLDKEEANYSVVGTGVVDVMILMGILDEKQMRQFDLEQKIASSFSTGLSAESKTLRKEFQKVLPKGVHFVHTKHLDRDDHAGKKYSVKFVFRVAKLSVLEELWKTYNQDKTLEKKLHQVLLSRKSISWNLSLDILFQEKDYNAVRRILGGTDEHDETEAAKEPSNNTQGDRKPALSDSETASPVEDHTKFSTQASKPEGPSKIKIAKPIPRVYLDDGSYNLSRELQLRDYQKELAAPALEGKNTIICAPTNSGKTFVAMEIAKRRLDAYKDCQNEACKDVPRPKVIFVVDKQNLVLQQKARFEEYLTNYSISDISGSNSDVIPLHRLIQDNDIVVLTAQILVNALEDKSVSISDISLLVFDECHHANKDHPYNQVMQEYLDLKIKKNVKDLPQVVGLTASLGVGQSNTKDKAKEHILQMCANLDASSISTVRRNIEDLINNVTGHVPVRTIVPPVHHDVQNVFEIEINKTMAEIENFVNKLRPNTPWPQTAPPTDRQVESYRQWIELLQNCTEISDNRTKYTCAEQLRKYHEALLINNTVRIDDAIKYITEYFDSLDESKFTENCALLQDLYKQTMKRIEDHIKENGKPDNPLLKVLEKLIIEFHEKNEEMQAKGILFTRTRDYTVALKRWMEETAELKFLKPDVLVGGGDGDIGLSQTQQEAVIKKFKTGEVNIIIATTVAEEGLDISDCSYVIRYGMLGNEISSVQSRGRIRAKEGNYVYMPDSRRRGVDHEVRNDYREMLMESALEEVQDMDESLFLDRINGLQKQILDELEIRNKMEASFKSQFEEEDHISFLCKKCEKYVCSSRDIRRYKKTNHVVVNPNVEKLYIVKKREKPEGCRGRFNDQKVHCKECDLDWGVVMLTKGTGWLCMKIKSFWVAFDDSDKRHIKNWKDVPFAIEDVTLDKLFELRKRLGQNPDGC